jgi:hypothetical protein
MKVSQAIVLSVFKRGISPTVTCSISYSLPVQCEETELTALMRVIFENLTVTLWSRKFAFSGIRSFATLFTSAL